MSTGPVEDKPKKARRPKNKPSITNANKPVIDALRDNLQGNKIWICKDDTIEVNRKPLVGFVCTPGEGISVEEHTQVLLSAINNMLSGNSDADAVIGAIMEEDEDDVPFHFIYPNMSDRNMWRDLIYFNMPELFNKRLHAMYGQDKQFDLTWVREYMRFMYIKSLHPTAVPSENIAKVWRLHLQYTESYGALCGLLEGRIAYEPLDKVSYQEQATMYLRTLTWYNTEFSAKPSSSAWNGVESLCIDVCIEPEKFWIFKKFWK